VEAYLEATEPGFRLYKRHGFEKCDEITTEDGSYIDTCMVRPSCTAMGVEKWQTDVAESNDIGEGQF
jgi:hypothetical protein